MYVDSNNLSQPLPYHEIKLVKIAKLEDILNTPDDSDIGFFFEVDLRYPHKIKEKTKIFPLALEKKYS